AMRRLAALLCVAGAARGGHEVVELDAPGKVAYRVARDLDGDGRDELLLVARHEIRLWRGRPEGPARHCDAALPMPEGAALFDVSDLDGDGKTAEIVVRTAEAYWALAEGSPPRRLECRSGRGLPPDPATVLWRALLADLDRDGKPDLVDVSLDGYRIDYGGGGSRTLPAMARESAETFAQAETERRVARVALPAWTQGDFDGDRVPDFAVVTESGLVVHPGDAAGRHDPGRSFLVDLPEAASADLHFRDLNRDGWMDALAVDRAAGEAYVLVAEGEPGLRKPARALLSVNGTLRQPVLEDFDGDGLPDLALPYFPDPTVQDAVRWFVRGEVLIEVPVFLNRGRTRCIRRPADTRVTIPIKIRVSADAGGRFSVSGLVVVEYGGDLDGDGRKDLVVTESPDRLAVHRGVPVTVFHEDANASIAVPDASAYDSVASAAAETNGDGRSDIIVHYRGAGRRPDRVFLLRSGKE
ncbi:MAG: FG-GAP repeat domain-containing protein, partial [Planctomycetota bacterium]